MNNPLIALSLLPTLLLVGCATGERSVLLGSGIGAGVGTSIGLLATSGSSGGNRAGAAAIGAVVGGLLGGLAGYSTYKYKRDKAMQMDNPSQIQMLGNQAGNTPRLRPAKIRIRYVEDQVKEGIFVPAHFEYEIAEPARWEQEPANGEKSK